MTIKVLKPGLATTVQDLGRPGYYHIGIPLSGGMDRHALTAANLLVGNEEGAAVLEAVFEVDVRGRCAERRHEFGEREIVRRDEANRARADKRTDNGFRADAPIVRIRAVQDLIEQEQHRNRPARQLHDRADAEDFGVKPRLPRLERIFDPERRADGQRRQAEARGPDRRTCLRQHDVDTDRT